MDIKDTTLTLTVLFGKWDMNTNILALNEYFMDLEQIKLGANQSSGVHYAS